MSLPLLKVAVVGHTNTGKTSLVRTLTRNRGFGEVADRGGTTRQVTTTELEVDGRVLIELYDSPGLENAPELIEWLDAQPGERHAGPARVARLLDDPEARQRFDQEARVLELMRAVDVGLYVIDAREPVLEKYQDELAILAMCARPIVAVLNFTSAPDSRESAWREALAEVTLHTVLAFDAAVRDPATERQLFEKLRSQLDRFDATLEAWLERLAEDEAQRQTAALRSVASLLIDAAAARRRADAEQPEELARVSAALQDAIRRREQATVDTLLALYRFGPEAYEDEALPLSEGRWADDLFDPETLRLHGIRAGKLAGLGAGAGALVDVATGGLSLGAGTIVGTLAGGGLSLLRGLGSRAVDRLRGRVGVAIDDATLMLLLTRQIELLASLRDRGHGNPDAIRPSSRPAGERAALPAPLRRARVHPEWSELNPSARLIERQPALAALTESLEAALRREG
ncbi:GTPase/DUF3482 domain-containing protein [Wenzhouxiangella marina]|uniref:GTP-binding protein, HSR1-like n=1 Tax=Wenzhouxiangella marina TaxID=1579979 RepID=A0A0K0XZN6_9GAMM|nr:GTPase/DUF3482 domain-containing protein [Wenzhouxiangella marina]AKS43102.1 GTP-binding protein, HSR1-like [Wenzhouxiangella marina]MBB6087213.1 hypothetical protein [Wenzhouxiangella marina]